MMVTEERRMEKEGPELSRSGLCPWDEKEGRRCATSFGIRTIGVLGVLISAKQSGSVSSFRSGIEALRRDAGFFVDKDLGTRVLAVVGE